jgi:chromosome partitioning protein
MIKIAVVHQKGGVGKSTIAQAIAVNFQGRSRIYDADAQATSSKFVESRLADGVENPDLATGRIDKLTSLVSKAEADGVDWFIIDTPPEQATEVNLRAALSVADFAILPTKAGANDVLVLPKTINIARQLSVPFAIVLNEYDNRRSLHKQVSADLAALAAQHGGAYLAPIRNLAVHQEASFARQCATEYAPSSDAARDLILMTRAIQKLIKETI